MKKDIFRKAALEKIATVDQLDRILKVTSPLSWLALLGVAIIIVMVVIWSFTGTLPATITASGMVVSTSASTNTYLAQASGTVTVLVSPGFVSKGTSVVQITYHDTKRTGTIGQNGYVTELLVKDGDTVSAGQELFRISPYVWADQQQVVVCYVPVGSADKITLGMQANITLSSWDSATYGHMLGRVTAIDNGTTKTKGIEAAVGSDNQMSSTFLKESSVRAVTLELYPPETPSSSSSNGYYWSNENGYRINVSNDMSCTVKIITEEQKPITKLFVKLKTILGGTT